MDNNEAENIRENVDAEAKDESVNAEEATEINAEAQNNGEDTETESSTETENEAEVENNAEAESEAEPEESAEGADDNSENNENTDGENAPAETGEENTGENKTPVFKKIGAFVKSKKFLIPLCSVFGAAALVYLGGALFYSGHFYMGTHIGSFDVSNLTPAEARDKIQTELDNFGFTFYEKNDKQETISGGEIGFSNSPIGELDSLKAQQNPFVWPFADKKAKNLPIDIEVSYNEDALYNRISEMEFMAATREAAKGKAQIYSMRTEPIR